VCIAIYKPEGKILSREILEQCWKANPDGAGYMYSHNNTLRVKKGFMTFKDFYAKWCNHAHKQAVLHFRIKTHGYVNAENTHPFVVSPDVLGFVHNGIISNVICDIDKDKSDTWHFNEKILKKLNKLSPEFFVDNDILDLLVAYIGYSKLIFMDKNNRVSIVNEAKGEWDGGIWYSNNSYKLPAKIIPYSRGTWRDGKWIEKESDIKPRVRPKPDWMKEKEDIKFDSIVRLSYDFANYPKHTSGIVEGFIGGSMVQVFLWGTINTSIKVPLWALELDETVIDYSNLTQ
jgi:glutamine amidotransferase